MAEFGKINVRMHVDLWSELLSKISEEGLSDLESAIVGERYRRKEIKMLEKPAGKMED